MMRAGDRSRLAVVFEELRTICPAKAADARQGIG